MRKKKKKDSEKLKLKGDLQFLAILQSWFGFVLYSIITPDEIVWNLQEAFP